MDVEGLMSDPLISPREKTNTTASFSLKASTDTFNETEFSSEMGTEHDGGGGAPEEDESKPKIKLSRPPGKWQLALLISTWVWLAELCGRRVFREFIAFNGWIDPNFVSFIQTAGNLGVLFYTVVDVLMPLLTFTYKGRQYGFGPWISYRATWLKQYKNFPMQIIAGAVTILEEGFHITDAPAAPLQSSNKDDSVVMHLKHVLRADKFEEYKRWVRDVNDIIVDYNGESLESEWRAPFAGTVDDVLREAIAYGSKRTTVTNEEGEMKSRRHLMSEIKPLAEDHEALTVTHQMNLYFEKEHYLNLWLASPPRHEFYQQLDFLLSSPEEVTFTDSRSRSSLPPAKWKAWMLNTMGQFLAAKWANSIFLPYYYDQWNLGSWSRV